MATIINNPGSESSAGGGFAFGIGLLILAAIILAFIFFGLPMLQNGGGTQVTIPDSIDVNVGTGGQGATQ